MSYAIAFDLSTDALKQYYSSTSPSNAYNEIGKFLNNRGFSRRQGSLYFGDNNVNAVQCVVVVQQLAQELRWFSRCVTDIRMLRIEDYNDLKPALVASIPIPVTV